MKKIMVILMAVFMIFGFSTAASAAFDLSFNIDFHTDGLSNPVHSYASGDYNTGDTIQLNPCEYVWVDFYADVTGEAFTGADLTLAFNAATLEATDATGAGGFVPIGSATIAPGSASISTGNFTGVTGNDNIFASILLHCIGLGIDDLYMSGLFADLASPAIVIEPPGCVVGTIENVPIPGALWLLGSGLIGLVGVRRRVR